jgi:hypothetical protein
MTVNQKDFGFFAFVGGCLLAALVLFLLLVGGQVAGPHIAQAPTHATQPY